METKLQLLTLLFVCTLNQFGTLMDENFYHGFMKCQVLLSTLPRWPFIAIQCQLRESVLRLSFVDMFYVQRSGLSLCR